MEPLQNIGLRNFLHFFVLVNVHGGLLSDENYIPTPFCDKADARNLHTDLGLVLTLKNQTTNKGIQSDQLNKPGPSKSSEICPKRTKKQPFNSLKKSKLTISSTVTNKFSSRARIIFPLICSAETTRLCIERL